MASCYSNISEVDRAQELLEQSVEIRKHLEEVDSLAYPYSTMGNIAYSRYDSSEAIKYFKKAHALFKKQGNEYFSNRNELHLADSFIRLGRYKEAREYLDMARPACEEFDEPVNHGYLHHLHGDICIHQGQYRDALAHLEKANNIYLQYGDLIERSILVTQGLILVHIELGDLEAAGEQVKSLRKLNKRIKEKDKILFKDVYCAYYDSCRGELEIERLDELLTQLDKLESELNINPNLEFWLLARCYINLENQKKADKIQEETTKRIKIDSKACSDSKDQDAYRSNGLHRQIMAPISPYEQGQKKSEKLSCKGCGSKLPLEFKFCPGCGARI
jgi:tetratricopeptide (TPR) repeat protein